MCIRDSSGSVHVVDEVAYDIITMYPENTKEQIVSAILNKYGSRPDVTEEDIVMCINAVSYTHLFDSFPYLAEALFDLFSVSREYAHDNVCLLYTSFNNIGT